MKTMHRTSTVGMAIGTVATAGGAIALTALTDTGAGGAYVFLFLGMFIFMLFLIWPERNRPFPGGPSRHRHVRGQRTRTGSELH
jgi:hypothetical protein